MSACGVMATISLLAYVELDFLPRELNELFLAAHMVLAPVLMVTAAIVLILSLLQVVRGPAVDRRRIGIWWGSIALAGVFDLETALGFVALLALSATLAILPGVWFVRRRREAG